MSLRDFVLLNDDRQYREVIVPEWDNRTVVLCSPASADRDTFEESLLKERTVQKPNGKRKKERVVSMANVRAKLVVICVCEAVGNPALVFKPEDADVLAHRNAAAIDRLYTVAQELAGITTADVEELAGNSDGDH